MPCTFYSFSTSVGGFHLAYYLARLIPMKMVLSGLVSTYYLYQYSWFFYSCAVLFERVYKYQCTWYFPWYFLVLFILYSYQHSWVSFCLLPGAADTNIAGSFLPISSGFVYQLIWYFFCARGGYLIPTLLVLIIYKIIILSTNIDGFVFAAMSYLSDRVRVLLLSHSLMTRFITYESCFLPYTGLFQLFFPIFLWLEREESSDSKNDMVLVVIMDHAVHVRSSR